MDWRFGANDTGLFAYGMTAAYFAAAAMCARAAFVRGREADTRVAVLLWAVLASASSLLGVNKLLDFQTLIIDGGKSVAQLLGLYEYKNILIAVFVVCFSAIVLAGAGAVCAVSHRHARRWKPLWTGFGLVGAYTVLRAASVLHLDRILNLPGLHWEYYWFFEPAGIGCIVLAALYEGPARGNSQEETAVKEPGNAGLSPGATHGEE